MGTVSEAATEEDRTHETDDGDESVRHLVAGLGALVVGLIVTAVGMLLTGRLEAAVLGVVVWVLVARYLLTASTVAATISRTGFIVAIGLLLVPAVALSPAAVVERVVGGPWIDWRPDADAAMLALFVVVPTLLAIVLAWLASRARPS